MKNIDSIREIKIDENQKINKCMKDCAFNVGGICKYLEFEGIDSHEMQCEHPMFELTSSFISSRL